MYVRIMRERLEKRSRARREAEAETICHRQVNARVNGKSSAAMEMLLRELLLEDLQLGCMDGRGYTCCVYAAEESAEIPAGYQELRAVYGCGTERRYFVREKAARLLEERWTTHPEWRTGRTICEGGREYHLQAAGERGEIIFRPCHF